MTLVEYIKMYKTLVDGEHLEDVEVSLGGRIMHKRTSSSKLFFYDLHDEGLMVQLMVDTSFTYCRSLSHYVNSLDQRREEPREMPFMVSSISGCGKGTTHRKGGNS